jgi:ectoine hydroxylase-related dioxygenase (phytanoyl-CoA dioxygenase family)
MTSSGVALEPHPWNAGFVWRDHEPPFTTVTPEQARQFDEAGYFVMEDAFTAEEMAALDAHIAPGESRVREFLKEMPDGRLSVAGVDTQTVAPHLVVQSDHLRDFCAQPLLAGLCRDLIGPDVRLYWEQAVYKQPHSAEPVLWHQDNGYTYVEPQAYLTCWIAITDATPDNGCVRVYPGVHRQGTLKHRNTPIGFECHGDEEHSVLAPVRAGSIVVFSSLTPHHTGRNHTDEVRKSYIVQYAPAGAEALQGDPDAGPSVGRVPMDDPQRQYWVVRDGERVEPAPSQA